jgi:5-methylcytosine-specific restriction protein B
VGSDWTNREPILGYPNALEQGDYVKPESGVLDLLIEANKPENQEKPYFLILDEMNLSHVERYFADFLSAMESGEPIPIHPQKGKWPNDIPAELTIPKNIFIIGTVNIDETTYMFSPKVLDRAQVIEFHITADQINHFLENPTKPDLNKLQGEGASSAKAFLSLAQSKRDLNESDKQTIQPILAEFFEKLKETGAEFGYRTALEITSLCAVLLQLTKKDGEPWSLLQTLDVAVAQKLLPKLHGSRKKLDPTLETLAALCLTTSTDDQSEVLDQLAKNPSEIFSTEEVRFPISLEKILRMKKRVQQEGFTSFAEA